MDQAAAGRTNGPEENPDAESLDGDAPQASPPISRQFGDVRILETGMVHTPAWVRPLSDVQFRLAGRAKASNRAYLIVRSLMVVCSLYSVAVVGFGLPVLPLVFLGIALVVGGGYLVLNARRNARDIVELRSGELTHRTLGSHGRSFVEWTQSPAAGEGSVGGHARRVR